MKEISFTLEQHDLVAFSRYMEQQGSGRRSFLLWMTLLGLVVFMMVVVDLRNGEVSLRTVGVIFFTFVFAIVYLFAHRISARHQFRDKEFAKRFTSRNRWTISPEGLTNTSEFGAESHPWTAISKIAATDDHAFLFLTRTVALLLPKRAFATGGEFEDFVTAAQKWRQEAIDAEGKHDTRIRAKDEGIRGERPT